MAFSLTKENYGVDFQTYSTLEDSKRVTECRTKLTFLVDIDIPPPYIAARAKCRCEHAH